MSTVFCALDLETVRFNQHINKALWAFAKTWWVVKIINIKLDQICQILLTRISEHWYYCRLTLQSRRKPDGLHLPNKIPDIAHLLQFPQIRFFKTNKIKVVLVINLSQRHFSNSTVFGIRTNPFQSQNISNWKVRCILMKVFCYSKSPSYKTVTKRHHLFLFYLLFKEEPVKIKQKHETFISW